MIILNSNIHPPNLDKRLVQEKCAFVNQDICIKI